MSFLGAMEERDGTADGHDSSLLVEERNDIDGSWAEDMQDWT